MENLWISLEVVFPLAAWMALGYSLRKKLNLDEDWVQKANVLAFRLLMPLLMFRNMVESDFHSVFSGELGRLIGYILFGYFVTYGLCMALAFCLVKDPARKGVIVQGIIRANTSIYGIPIAVALFGEGNIGNIGLMVGMMVPVFNISSVVALEIFRSGKINWKNILLNVVKNPLIIGITGGVLWNMLRIPMPAMIQDTIWKLAACASPLSFIVLGAGFTFARANQNRKALTAVSLARLVVVPGVWILVAVGLGFRGADLLCVLVIFAPPTAVTSYALASAMGGDSKLSNEIVVFTSAFSIATVFGWVWLLKTLQLL